MEQNGIIFPLNRNVSYKVTLKNKIDLLTKNPQKRMDIKEVLIHPWIKNNSKSKLCEMRKMSNNNSFPSFQYFTTLNNDNVYNVKEVN
jgi:hypothetical protein